MEQSILNIENQEIMGGVIPDVMETILTKRVTRVKLDDYAFQQAGFYKGDSIALENQLSWIIEGHLVDIGYNDADINLKKEKIVDAITDKEKELNQHKTDQQKIKDVSIIEREKEKKKKSKRLMR